MKVHSTKKCNLTKQVIRCNLAEKNESDVKLKFGLKSVFKKKKWPIAISRNKGKTMWQHTRFGLKSLYCCNFYEKINRPPDFAGIEKRPQTERDNLKDTLSLSMWSNYPLFIFLCPKIVSKQYPRKKTRVPELSN